MTSYVSNVIPFGPVPNASRLTGRGGPPPVGEATPDSADNQDDPLPQDASSQNDDNETVEEMESPAADKDLQEEDLPSYADARSIIEAVCVDDDLDLSGMPAPMLRMLLQPRLIQTGRINPLESPEKSIQIMLETIYSRFTVSDASQHSAVR